MKLGLLTAAFPDLSLREVCQWAGDNDFKAVEIAVWPKLEGNVRRYAGTSHIDVKNLGRDEAQQIRGEIDQQGLEISALAYYPNPLDGDREGAQAAIAHLKEVIRAAERLDVRIVGTFIGRNHKQSIEENFAHFSKVWPDIIRFAGDHNVMIAIENCPMIFSQDEWPGGKNLAYCPAHWRRMFETIGDKNFGLNLDPSHLLWQFIDTVRVVKEFGDKIFHVHAKDIEIDNQGLYDHGVMSAGMGWQIPRLCGLGQVDWSAFFSALYAVGYDGVVSIEHEDRIFEGTGDKVKRGFLIARDTIRPFLH